MKITVHCISVVLLWCSCTVAYAQPAIRFTRLTKEDGLSSDVVYDLHQDRSGFLWIATHGGLDRYDGYRFRHFRYDPHDTNSISGNFVHCIQEDSEGILWITNNNGLNSLDPRTGIVKRFTPSPATMSKEMGDLLLVNDSILLVMGNNTVYSFNKQRYSFTEIQLPPFRDHPQLLKAKFITGYKGMILVNRGNRQNDCLKIDWQQHTASFIPILDLLQIPGNEKPIYNLHFDRRGNPWCFSTGEHLLLTKNISGRDVKYPFINKDVNGFENIITGFLEDNDRMWISTGNGLVYYDYTQGKFYRYTQQPGNGTSLSNNRVQCMMKDKAGLYWVGTFGGGVCYFQVNDYFKNIAIDTSNYDSDRKVYGLQALHSGRIVVSTMTGKKFMMEKDKSLHVLDYARDFKTPVLLDDLVKELTGKTVQSFSATGVNALNQYFHSNLKADPLKNIVTAEGVKNAFHSGRLFTNEQNKVWVKFFDNRLYDGVDNHWYKQQVNDIEMIADNYFLFATNNGLLEYYTQRDTVIKTWLPQPGNPNSIGSNGISCISPDGKGNYWIGTNDAGLDFWDVKSGKFFHYTINNGLPDNKIYCILPDQRGRLWMSTDKGLSCFDTAAKTFTNYSRQDGLINSEYNGGSACIGKDGWFYFGGMNGIDYFHPDSINTKMAVPQLRLAAFRVYDRELPLADRYALETADNNIQLGFFAGDLFHASKLLLRYRLSDVDAQWVIKKGMNVAQYNKLPPGDYAFEVSGSYDGQSWSKPLTISFTIATPWFQSSWFFAALLAAAVAGTWLLFRYRLQQELKLFRLRYRIHRDLHDDVGATLSSVKAYSEILRDNPDNPLIAELIKDNAAEMIDRLDVIAWATNPHHDSFDSFYNKLQRYAAPLCLARKISFSFTVNGIAKETVMPGDIRQNIFLVAKEAVNNSVKYAQAAHLSLDTRIDAGKFMMIITDDGKGFDTTGTSLGNGLNNMQSRISDIGGSFHINSEVGRGTQIRIQLAYPFKIPYFRDRNSASG